MSKNIVKGQTIGGSADILARMGKDRLEKLWHETAAKLSEINPIEDYESYAYNSALFDAVVKAYYGLEDVRFQRK